MIPLQDFVAESNRIEGIMRPPTQAEIMAHCNFLKLREAVTVADVEQLVRVLQPGAMLRRHPGMNVRVGRYIAPAGGPTIEPALAEILKNARAHGTPFSIHCDYELLHPFTDGNGRSGRALWLWLWVMRRRYPQYPSLGFLHTFYYQTLEFLS